MQGSKFMTKLFTTVGAAAIALGMPATAFAQSRATDPSTLDILDVLVEKGLLNRAEADGVLAEARKRSEADAGTVRVPYVPEAIRNQIREEVKRDVVATAKSEGWAQPGSLPGWLGRFDLSGDVRVRVERQGYGGANTPLVPDINAINADGGLAVTDVLPLRAVTKDRYRSRVRARLAIDAKVTDHVDAGIRFATGNLDDPLSTNESLTGNFGKLTVGLDRAYVRVRPFARDSRFAKSNVVFGKFDNPFFSTEMVFDRDLQFDGVAATFNAALGDGAGAPEVFLTAGAFPLEEWDFTGNDKFLFAGQIGASGSPVAGLRLKAAAALYAYENVQGQYNTLNLRDNDYTAPDRVQFGNALFNLRRDGGFINTYKFGLASKFRVAAVNFKGEFDLNPTLVASIEFEGLKNLAFDTKDLIARSDDPTRPLVSSGDTAWHARLSIGHPEMDVGNAWRLSAGYRELQGDATLDLFTDSDFGLGGTDQKGFVVQGSWAFAKNVWLNGAWYSARTINLVDPYTGATALPVDIDTYMLDLNVKF